MDGFASPDRFAEDPDQLRRARLLVVCGASVLVWGPFFALSYAAAGFPWIATGVGLSSGLIATSMVGLRRGWSTTVSGNLFTASIYAIHVMMLLRTGGLDSPALPWVSVVVIGGVAFCGIRWGLFWGAVASLEIALLAFGLLADVKLPGIGDPQLHRWLVLAAVGGQCGVVLMFAAAFEWEKDRSLRALSLARDRERRANEAKSRFVANMSHEVRTPMNAILGMTELSLSEPLEADHRDRLEIVQEAATSLLDLLNDVLDLSKIESVGVVREKRTLRVRRVVSDVVRLLAGRAAAKGLTIDVDVAADVPEATTSDPVGLRQVLINLVGNAIKFSSEGGVRLCVRSSEGEAGAPAIRFEVTDVGPGVDLEAADRIFAPFEQADMSETRAHGGTGLGLSIARSIVEGLGGRIWFDRDYRAGARFCFELPVEVPRLAPETDAASAGSALDSLDAFDLAMPMEGHLLVVEDNPVNRRVAREILERAGFAVEVAVDGVEALESIAAARPAMILMDCQMPRMDGFEATRRIRTAELETGSSRLPIVGVTASVLHEDRSRCFEVGMDAHVPKPIDRGELMGVLQSLLERAKEETMLRVEAANETP